jgi:glyoxalase/bleomycin resistance protein/dioxygenase superfamily protein
VSGAFGPIRQLGYVVRDIEAAMAHWTDVLGVGPFFFFPRVVALDATYRGQPQPFEVAIALSNSGPTQIELMCQLDGGPSALRDFAERHGEGLHHTAFWTSAFDADLATFEQRGYGVWQRGAIGSRDNRFAYLERGDQTVIELSEVSGFKSKLFAFIAETCASWDGTKPVRSL